MTASIQEALHKAGLAEDKIGEILARTNGDPDETESERKWDAETMLQYHVEQLYRDVGILAERLSLPQLAKDIRKERKRLKPAKMVDMGVTPDGDFYSTTLGKLRGYFRSLSTITKAGAVSGLQVFQTILENTAIIIHESRIDASNEAKVRNEVLKVLRYSFRDTLKEVSAAKTFKVYKPDIGVASLMAAVEYKYVDSETALKKALDDIYADMRGYSGHYDWRTFYAVIYMTAPFAHQKEWEEEFRFAKADVNWTPIIVNGPGERKRKPRAPRSDLAAATTMT
ncbi:hypothetical protein QO058_30790 (plasmid) [Bosea vestrisii]|uniref:PD-(D/E)XK nuclease domain-containing protein n=1 Tax=Bosea vestrisii TaxID=151416 RepID=UPI0024DF5093|nr:hypothetical protein [Bosea vestrisii]WID99782.1 hypothetical protein QO058_30790 [Bosea vestrisii]